jgi:hypothetical protein
VQEFNDYVYRSFIANNKDFCILTVTELPMKRWLWGEGPVQFPTVWRDAKRVGWIWDLGARPPLVGPSCLVRGWRG